MPRRFTGRTRIPSGQKRQTRWLDGPTTAQTLAGGNTAALILSLTTEELALRPFTIVRTRGIFRCSSDQQGASEQYECSLGMAVVSDEARTVGITAVPTPEEQRASDLWFVYESLSGEFVFGSVASFVETHGPEVRFDSKGMRKVEEGQDVVVVLQNSAISSGTISIVSFRMLIKLH